MFSRNVSRSIGRLLTHQVGANTTHTASSFINVRNFSKAANKPPLPESIDIKLTIRDMDVLQALARAVAVQGEDTPISKPSAARDEALLAILRIGSLSLKHAQAQTDTTAVRSEVDRLLVSLENKLNDHSKSVQRELHMRLAEYFDPRDGRFEERVRRLLASDGELNMVLQNSLSRAGTDISKQLSPLLGPESFLQRALDPDNTRGLSATVERIVKLQLEASQRAFLSEFSLDNRQGALSRIVEELRAASSAQAATTDAAVRALSLKFSLDDPASALSRMVAAAHSSASAAQAQLTLDDENSALSRLRRELLEVSKAQADAVAAVREAVVKEMAAAKAEREARKIAEKATTLHGATFETAVADTVSAFIGDGEGALVERVGGRTGAVRNCKVGDVVVSMGSDHVAAGARIVIEAKDARGYTVGSALTELDVARRNRGADVGVFVFRRGTVAAAAPLWREGDSILCEFEPEEVHGDAYVRAALSLARALLVRKAQTPEEPHMSANESAKLWTAVDRALRELEREAETLGDARKLVENIMSNADKLQQRLRIGAGRVADAAMVLDDAMAKVRGEQGVERKTRKSSTGTGTGAGAGTGTGTGPGKKNDASVESGNVDA